MPIDYARMQKSSPRLKSMLTRAQKLADPEARYIAVRKACFAAVTEWNAVGAWIDDWSRWQRALDDAAYAAQRAGVVSVSYCHRLEDL